MVKGGSFHLVHWARNYPSIALGGYARSITHRYGLDYDPVEQNIATRSPQSTALTCCV